MAERIQATCVMCFMRDARGYDRGMPLCGMCEKDVRKALEFLAYHARGPDDKPLDDAVRGKSGAEEKK